MGLQNIGLNIWGPQNVRPNIWGSARKYWHGTLVLKVREYPLGHKVSRLFFSFVGIGSFCKDQSDFKDPRKGIVGMVTTSKTQG